MTGDEHQHCFCSTNTIGQPMCCRCGRIVNQVDIYDKVDIFLMWEKMGHERRKIDNLAEEKAEGKSKQRLPGF